MASDTPLSGTRFRLYRKAGGPAVFVCLATTLSLNMSNEYDDATMPDCDTPTKIPVRASLKKSSGWSVNFSGAAVPKHFATLRDDFAADAPVEYQITLDPADGLGAGSWTGDVHIESLELGKTDNGRVNFTASMRGDGELVWTAA